MWPLYVQTAMTENIKTGTTEVARHQPDRSGRRRRDRRGGRARPGCGDAIHQVHFPVGTQTKASVVLSRFSPAWLQRLLNKTAGRHLAFVFAVIATVPDRRRRSLRFARMNEDWLAVIVGLALLVLVLVGAIPGSVIP